MANFNAHILSKIYPAITLDEKGEAVLIGRDGKPDPLTPRELARLIRQARQARLWQQFGDDRVECVDLGAHPSDEPCPDAQTIPRVRI